MTKDREKLFSEFPPVSKAEWKEQVIKDLKGRGFEKLVWSTYEKIEVDPFYTREDLNQLSDQTELVPGEFPFTRGSSSRTNDWKINQEITDSDIRRANSIALNSLKGGSTSLTFNCRVDTTGFTGIPIQTRDDMALLLKDIDLEKISINFEPGINPLGIASLYILEAKRQNLDLAKLEGSVNFDPLGYLSLNGRFSGREAALFGQLRELISYLGNNMPHFKALTVNSTSFNNSGASITQELAYTLAKGVEYLDRLTEMDLTVDQISGQMSFSFSIGSNYFMEIAKLRAARMLWANIIEQYNPKEESSKLMSIKVVNSSWNKTQYDPFVNLLRGTVETMAGALGGVDSITVRPLDSEYRNPDEFSLRMSRNTQLILKNESYLEHVVDPSAGSYYIENLTASIAKESWKQFQDVERTGGFIKSFNSGIIQDAISETRKSRDMNIALRKDIFLGVNQYPNLTEDISSKIKDKNHVTDIKKSDNKVSEDQRQFIEYALDYLSADGVFAGDLINDEQDKPGQEVEPLKAYRGAQVFEELRLATEKYATQSGRRPVVFLLTIGNPSMRSARATFTANFFGCAGYEIINNIGFKTLEDGVEKALESNPDIVVICSSDDEYAEYAPSIINGLKQASSEIKIIIAGNPKEHIDELQKTGVDDFIHVRSNALEILSKYQKILGINQ